LNAFTTASSVTSIRLWRKIWC